MYKMLFFGFNTCIKANLPLDLYQVLNKQVPVAVHEAQVPVPVLS